MLNQVIIVGRLANEVKLKENEDKKVAVITLACPRTFKNEEGVYNTDFINCTLWQGIAENTAEYCRKGDLIGIKGRVQENDGQLSIIAEKVTFLSSNKKGE